MKRYNLLDGEVYGKRYQMVEETNGDWVWYEDVEAQCAELESKCAELESKCAELLEALKRLEQDGQGYCICYMPSEDYNDAWDHAETVIAKAEGAQP